MRRISERCDTKHLLTGSSSPLRRHTGGGGRRGPVHTLGQHLHTFSSLKCLQRASSSISAGQRRAALQRVLFPSHQTQVTFWPWGSVVVLPPGSARTPACPKPSQPCASLPFSSGVAAWLKGPLCLP